MFNDSYTTENDLDIVISNLFNEEKNKVERTHSCVKNNSDDLIDRSIQMKTLPISLRKRVLYNLTLNSKS